jgi:hypothetical protein
MRASTFKNRAEAGLRTANPGADIQIEWQHGPVRVTWADGSDGFSGVMAVTAPGFHDRVMVASSIDGMVTVGRGAVGMAGKTG